MNIMWRNFVPGWHILRNIGNLAAVRLTIFIPLVGYLVVFNNKVVEWLELTKEFVGVPPAIGLTVSPRLLLIYFGLCAVAVGSAIYSMLCPQEIKHYGTSAAYVGGDGPNIGDIAMRLSCRAQRRSPKNEKILLNGVARSTMEFCTSISNIRTAYGGSLASARQFCFSSDSAAC